MPELGSRRSTSFPKRLRQWAVSIAAIGTLSVLIGGAGARAADPPMFAAASVRASPGLQCKLYPEGGSPSAAVDVDTDDDGYARFYAVRASASDPVRSMTLDCVTASGAHSSYPVDLTSAETFAPNPLDLSKQNGVDRPALTGDPMGYSQSELIQKGYGLRPDPNKDPTAYASWLATATRPGRMLTAKHPEKPTHGVTTATAPWWVGSVLTGAPNYLATIATFNVPTGIPGGGGTTTTAIAIWNGLGGMAGSGLIQGGVNVDTTPGAATYYTWREYCCGDPNSNGYGGNFVPNPGDKIFSEEWYCDENGGVNLNGGYGCTYLFDQTSGAIFNCTLPKGTPCWSVPALPLCSANPKVKSCMTIGKTAEFIIEDQSPQVGPSSAYTDFAGTVTIDGLAFSSKAGGSYETVTTDPSVLLLTDFTHDETHINVSLGSTNQTNFNISYLRIGPPVATKPNVSVYNTQQHFAYVDTNHTVQDVWYDGEWHLQQLTQKPSALPNEFIVSAPGPAPAGDVFASVYNNQQHFAYRDTKNNIQDVWWGGSSWNLQQLTESPPTLPKEYVVGAPGPTAAGNVSASVYNNQQHFAYRDAKNNIQDVWWSGSSWNLQQLTEAPSTQPREYIVDAPGPTAAGDLAISVYNGQQHFAYRDQHGAIQDVWFDGKKWNLQQLTQQPPTSPKEYIVNSPGPAAVGDPAISVYNGQQHFAYRDGRGALQDVWFDGKKWNLQQLTQGPSTLPGEDVVNAPGPAAAGDPAISVYNGQQHFAYRDGRGAIQDVWFDGKKWNLQQLTQRPSTVADEYVVGAPGPAAAGDPFVSVYNNQQHFSYRDRNNSLQDVWYGSDGWHQQQLSQ